MPKPPSLRSNHADEDATEHSPLLAQEDGAQIPNPTHSEVQTRRRRWPSLIALAALCAGIIAVLAVGFLAPAIAEQYAGEAIVLSLDSVSDISFIDSGARMRVRGSVDIDAGRVHNQATRTLGRAGAWIARKVDTGDFTIDVYAPDHQDQLLGSAEGPPIVIDIRNGHSTPLDFFVESRPGELAAIRDIMDDYLRGQLGAFQVSGVIKMRPKSGILHLGGVEVTREILLEGLPSIPQYKITELRFGEVKQSHSTVMNGNVSVLVANPYLLDFSIPRLGFGVSIAGCEMESHVSVATASSYPIHIQPQRDVEVNVVGTIHGLPKDLTTACPQSKLSPMDNFLASYLHGLDSVVYITGKELDEPGTPAWLSQFLESITVPVPFPGHTFENVIDTFSLSHVKIELPPDALDPGAPALMPLLSADIEVIIRLPDEVNVTLDVRRLKSEARISYEDKFFGTLNMADWEDATSSKVGNGSALKVKAELDRVPLNVTDYGVFQKIVKKMLFGGGKGLRLGIDGLTDVDVTTVLGNIVVRQLPASGNITLDDFPSFGSFPLPVARDISIESSTSQSLRAKLSIAVENPTTWEAIVPDASIHIVYEDTVLGLAEVSDAHVSSGSNIIGAIIAWQPIHHGGEEAEAIGADFIGKYISGYNTTITLRVHENSIPALPDLSNALAGLEITIPTPRLGGGRDGDSSDPPKFIETATMHIISSTADFVLANPLLHDRLMILVVNATAKYNGSELGSIFYDEPFRLRPGAEGTTNTPRLPVDWSFGSIAYDALRKALGGKLEVHAEAYCTLAIGNMVTRVFYNSSKAIPAGIRL